MIEPPLFEVHSPNGQVYKVWKNGRIEGFPDESWIVNRWPIYAHEYLMQGQLKLDAA